MRLSSKSLTAIKMFIDLAEQKENGFISLMDISKRKEVSKNFLEQIVILYKKKGLIIGSRGNQGGYKLAKEPHLITLKEIIEVSENSLFEEQKGEGVMDEVLNEANQLIDDYFSSITLSALVMKQLFSYKNSYCI